MGKEPKDSEIPAETITEGLIRTVDELRGKYPALVAELETEVETVADLESFYPELVEQIKATVVEDIGQATPAQVQQKLPELFERIIKTVDVDRGSDLKVPGFLLEFDDPFAHATLTFYQKLRGSDNMRLPCVIPVKDKAKGMTNESAVVAWRNKFEKVEALAGQFKNIKAFIAYKSRRTVQALEYYVLMAEGAGDNDRAAAAKKALLKMQ